MKCRITIPRNAVGEPTDITMKVIAISAEEIEALETKMAACKGPYKEIEMTFGEE